MEKKKNHRYPLYINYRYTRVRNAVLNVPYFGIFLTPFKMYDSLSWNKPRARCLRKMTYEQTCKAFE